MGLITENKLSKTIIYTFIIIMSSMIFAISYFYVKNTYDNFEVEMNKFEQEYYLNKKKFLKNEINTILEILNYNIKKKSIKYS